MSLCSPRRPSALIEHFLVLEEPFELSLLSHFLGLEVAQTPLILAVGSLGYIVSFSFKSKPTKKFPAVIIQLQETNLDMDNKIH